MSVVLTTITLIAALALSGIYLLTKTQIEQQARLREQAARRAVLAGHEDGVAVQATAVGFNGPITIMIGFAPDSTILGYEILEQAETPGLGTHVVEWFKNADKPGQNIVGRQADGMFTVSKDGGSVDAITAATISSRAFLKAVNEAFTQFANTNSHEE